jgi:hypothetical protein
MGVTLYRDIAPGGFGTFDRALGSMFRLTAGETWLDGLAAADPDTGAVYFGRSLFVYRCAGPAVIGGTRVAR